MQKKLLASVFIALLIGLGAGYSLAYNINLQQNQQLETFNASQQNLKTKNSTPTNVTVTNWPTTMNVDVANLPTTLNVAVTNWPPEKADSKLIHLGRFTIPSGRAHLYSIPDWNNPIASDGYKKFSILYEIWDMSPGYYSLNVSVAAITWIILRGPYSYEYVHTAQTTLTRHSSGFEATKPNIDLIEIKAPYFALEFRTETNEPDWPSIWVTINVYVYLRN